MAEAPRSGGGSGEVGGTAVPQASVLGVWETGDCRGASADTVPKGPAPQPRRAPGPAGR